MDRFQNKTLAIIGAGNLGMAIINGLLSAGFLNKNKLIVTKRKLESLEFLSEKGVPTYPR